VTLREVGKSYGDLEVVNGVSMEIADGELVVIVGPSGCGKSTLLRMVAGLEDITRGEIAIGGKVVKERDRGACEEGVFVTMPERIETSALHLDVLAT
jgi:ABC-type sugar transport system ATPase subunit